jgi:hypothetical protein
MQEFTVTVFVASLPEATGLTLNISASPGDDIVISGTITDGQGISSIHIVNPGVELDQLIEPQGTPLSYELNFSHTIPAEADLTVHKGTITVTNTGNRAVTFNLNINLSGQEITYEAMYVAGGVTWWTWNAEHAYMMIPDENDDNWFEIILPAWPEDGFNEVKFIGQLSWEPDNWGLVDNTDPSQGMINDQSSQPILLDAAGSAYYPGYFRVRFNPYELTYSSEEVDQAGFAAQETMYIVGSGFEDYPDLDWNPEEAIPMERNPYGFGEHIFIVEGLKFSEEVSLKFIGQNDGWNPLDVGFDEAYIVDIDPDNSGYQVTEPVNWLPTKSGSGSADLKFSGQAGNYTVMYDHFAQRALIWQE